MSQTCELGYRGVVRYIFFLIFHYHTLDQSDVDIARGSLSDLVGLPPEPQK